MSELWQEIVVGIVVLCAILYLMTQARKSKCEKGGCGCDAKTSQQRLASGPPEQKPPPGPG